MVTRSHWLPDSGVAKCVHPSCTKLFSFTERRHHCRKCGLIFCKQHTNYQLYLDKQGNPISSEPSEGTKCCRVCVLCYDEFVDRDRGPLPMPRSAKANQIDTSKRIQKDQEHLRLLEEQHCTYKNGPHCDPWVDSIYVVRFDLKVGQVIDCMHPSLGLTAQQEVDLSFLSFPDSNVLGESQHTIYNFVYELMLNGTGQTLFNSFSVVNSEESESEDDNEDDDSSDCQSDSSASSTGNDVGFYFSSLPTDGSSHVIKAKMTTDVKFRQSALLFQNNATPKEDSTYSREIFGYVYYHQKRDDTRPRGAFQKALVIMSTYPFMGLFAEVLRTIGLSFFQDSNDGHEKAIITSAYEQIQTWPHPLPNTKYELPMFGNVIRYTTSNYGSPHFHKWSLAPTGPTKGRQENIHKTANIPLLLPKDGSGSENAKLKSSRRSLEFISQIIPPNERHYPFWDNSLHIVFYSHLSYLWKLWEIMISGEPLCVYSPDVTTCSLAVIGCTSLIAPLTYCGLVRPFLTVSSPEFAAISGLESKTASVLIGGTNPYFLKAFEKWPHLLSMTPISAEKAPSPLKSGTENERIDISDKCNDRLFTKRRFVVQTEISVVKSLLKYPNDGEWVDKDSIANVEWRSLFFELTKAFLKPLQDCFNSVWIAKKPHFLPQSEYDGLFLPSVFVEYVQRHGYPNDIFKRNRGDDVLGLYRKFTGTLHFKHWLQTTIASAHRVLILQAKDLASLSRSNRDIGELLQKMLDRECKNSMVDEILVTKLQQLLKT